MLNLSNKTVAELRKSNFRVKVHHYRHIRHDDGERTEFVALCDVQNRTKMLPKGGKTEIFITTPEGKQYKGSAGCVRSDAFCYKRGVSIALGRLEEVEAAKTN